MPLHECTGFNEPAVNVSLTPRVGGDDIGWMIDPDSFTVEFVHSCGAAGPRLGHAVLPLFALSKGVAATPVGTCFVIATSDGGQKALAMTARHNLLALAEGLLGKAEVNRRKRFCEPINWREDGFVMAMMDDTAPWIRATELWPSPAGDVALVVLELQEAGGQFDCALKLDSTPLRVGEDVVALGQILTDKSPPPDWENGRFPGLVELDTLVRPGAVSDCHPFGKSIHKWPGFTVSASFDGGMSGGPVLDVRGFVRGVVGGDMTLSADSGVPDLTPQGFITAVWTGMLTPIPSPESAAPQQATLVDLVHSRSVWDESDPQKHVVLVRGGAGGLAWIDPPLGAPIGQVSPFSRRL